MLNHLLVVVLWLASPTLHHVTAQKNLASFESIVYGRCLEYQEIHRPDLYSTSPRNCTRLVELMVKGFQNATPCSVEPGGYDDFSRETSQLYPRDSGLFWEKTFPFVRAFGNRGKRYTTIEATFGGYIGDDMSWCPGSGDFQCSNCYKSASLAYWRSVSAVFAANAEGQVQVMLNGSVDTAYLNTSVFAMYEMAYWNKSRVTNVDIWLIHNVGGPFKERCNAGSLLKLQNTLTNLGFPHKCIENPASVRHMQCIDHVGHSDCNNLCPSGAPSVGQNKLLLKLFMIITCYILTV